MITPILGSRYPAVRGWTSFHLHLAPSENGNDLSTQLRDVRPTLLLFLRQLRAFCITIPGVTLEVRRTDDGDRDMVSLERIREWDERRGEIYLSEAYSSNARRRAR
jgi:hypothetical protein